MSAVSHVGTAIGPPHRMTKKKKQEKRVKRTEQTENGELKGQFKAKNILITP